MGSIGKPAKVREIGFVSTPEKIVDFMISLLDVDWLKTRNELSILEPGCGGAPFLSGIKRHFPDVYRQASLTGIELSRDVLDKFRRDIDKRVKIIHGDYLLWEPDELFDLIIGNPPYGIPANTYHYPIKVTDEVKAKYKRAIATWSRKYNMYGAFIEKSIRLLKQDGILLFITPATFLFKIDFSKLRRFMSDMGDSRIIYLGEGHFDEAKVSVAVIHFRRTDRKNRRVVFCELKRGKIKTLQRKTNWTGEAISFETEYTRRLESSCRFKIKDIYDVHFSPRIVIVERNPCVVESKSPLDGDFLPILSPKNVQPYEIIYKGFHNLYVRKRDMKKLARYLTSPRIIVPVYFLGTRKDGLGVAYDRKCYPFMGDAYNLVRRNGLDFLQFDMSEDDVLDYLNSKHPTKYLRDKYRRATYHTTLQHIENLPLPTKKEWKKIKSWKIND